MKVRIKSDQKETKNGTNFKFKIEFNLKISF